MTAGTPGGDRPGGFSGLLKRGAAMAGAGVAVVQVVTIISTLVLARLLGPHEVGVFAAGSVLVGTLALFAQGTLTQALIQREHEVEDAANTALIATIVTGLLLGLAALVAAPLIGALFHDSRVGMIAAATAGLALLHACPSVPDALMQRAFQFKRRIIIDPAVAVTFAVVAIVSATQGCGAWSLVLGTYASVLTWILLSWWLAKWRPFRGRFSFRILRELVGFSVPLFIDGVVERLREALQQVLVGRWLGTAELGQYRYALRLASMPSVAVIQVCSYVLFPAFSRIAEDSLRFRAAFLRALGWIWFAVLPVCALLLVLGQPVVVLLLGEPWRPAGLAAAAMAGIGLGVALTSVAVEAIKGAGRSSLLNWMTAAGIGFGVPLILALLPFGLVGVAIALSAAYVVVGFLGLEMSRRVVGASARDVVTRLLPPTVSALVALVAVSSLEWLVVRSGRFVEPVAIAAILLECLVFAVVYLVGLRVVSPSWYRAVRDAAGRGQATVTTSVRRWVAS